MAPKPRLPKYMIKNTRIHSFMRLLNPTGTTVDPRHASSKWSIAHSSNTSPMHRPPRLLTLHTTTSSSATQPHTRMSVSAMFLRYFSVFIVLLQDYYLTETSLVVVCCVVLYCAMLWCGVLCCGAGNGYWKTCRCLRPCLAFGWSTRRRTLYDHYHYYYYYHYDHYYHYYHYDHYH
jgi:hypothetical protein